jgi:hypothetical protein
MSILRLPTHRQVVFPYRLLRFMTSRNAAPQNQNWGRVLQSNFFRREAGLTAGLSFVSPLSSFAGDRVSWLARNASRFTNDGLYERLKKCWKFK